MLLAVDRNFNVYILWFIMVHSCRVLLITYYGLYLVGLLYLHITVHILSCYLGSMFRIIVEMLFILIEKRLVIASNCAAKWLNKQRYHFEFSSH